MLKPKISRKTLAELIRLGREGWAWPNVGEELGLSDHHAKLAWQHYRSEDDRRARHQVQRYRHTVLSRELEKANKAAAAPAIGTLSGQCFQDDPRAIREYGRAPQSIDLRVSSTPSSVTWAVR